MIEPVTFLDQLRKTVIYCPDTGIFMWAKRDGDPRWNAQWAGKIAGSVDRTGYRRFKVAGKAQQAHRMAWWLHHGRQPAAYIDHINGDKTDNRIANLREASPAQSVMNVKRHRDNKCGFKGVSYNPRIKRWRALIGVGGKQIYLGSYPTPEKAHEAYVTASATYHGEFARWA